MWIRNQSGSALIDAKIVMALDSRVVAYCTGDTNSVSVALGIYGDGKEALAALDYIHAHLSVGREKVCVMPEKRFTAGLVPPCGMSFDDCVKLHGGPNALCSWRLLCSRIHKGDDNADQ